MVLFIIVCIASCGYYRRRQRFLAMRRQVPAGVVVFSRGSERPEDLSLPPSYQETVSKPAVYPPPYYSAGKSQVIAGDGNPQKRWTMFGGIYSNIVALNTRPFTRYVRRHPSKRINTKKLPEKLFI